MTTQIGTTPSDPYITPDTIPPTPVAGVLETTITASLQTIVSGTTIVNAETFNGAIPGPTLRLNVGDTAVVRLINKLPYPTGIHWHGIELANSADGTEVTQDGVPPASPVAPPGGGTYLYKFKVPRPGVYWYHPHHHHSPNRVFRGLYGMIIVTDPDDTTLSNGVLPNGFVLPGPADTKQLVLSDITVCKPVGSNTSYDLTLPWVGTITPGQTFGMPLPPQFSPTPANLCELPTATQDDGAPAVASYAAGDVPSIMSTAGWMNEGQTVLTNGVNVGARGGSPSAPGALAAGAYKLPVLSGQGLRLQIVNCATARYFRLILTTGTGVQVPLMRIGGEGGLLDRAGLEGGVIGPFDFKYTVGEILIPPSVRVDIVAAIPAGLPVGSVLTLWTQDFIRLYGTEGFSYVPTVPVMHLEVTGAVAGAPYTISAADPLRARAGFPGARVESLRGEAATTLLTPLGGFVAPKLGMLNSDIQISAGSPGINGIAGSFEGPPPYTDLLHLNSSRYAEAGRTLELSVTNKTANHHPFHLHGFSFQPISLTQPGAPSFFWSYNEFRDSLDVPAQYTLTFRVRLDDRPLLDGVTLGGHLGRWLFHCHIFWHHNLGMISELVVTGADGSEKPYVDVDGSWAYVPSGGIATRHGTFDSPDGLAVSLSASVGNVTANPGGTWDWSYDTTGVPNGIQYVYITATDSEGRKGQTVFRLKIGAPDDGADNGDPHISTVDGKFYDFQAAGEFTLLTDNEGMEIQVRQTPVETANPVVDGDSGLTSCASVNTAVAARIGTHRIAYQPLRPDGRELEFFLDGERTALTEKGIDLESGRVVAFPVGDTVGLRVDYANYTVLTVTPYFWSHYNIWILNIQVTHTDADQGIMGPIPAQTWLPLLPSGATVGPMPTDLHDRYITLYRTFADAWRVTDKTSLFVYAPETSTKTFTDVEWPPEKPPFELKPEFQILGANPPLENIEQETAEQICKPVGPDDLYRGCVLDVATTGDETLVESYLLAQELRRRSTVVQIIAGKAQTQPGEPVILTATVSALNGSQPPPIGLITFLIDDEPVEKPIEPDRWGRAYLKTANMSAGVHRIRAVFTAADEPHHDSSSPSLSHRVERKPPADRTNAQYQISGLFYEACDCNTICPCWLGDLPDGGECTGVFAWDIQRGTIDGVDVTGLRAVSVSYHSGLREEARQRVVIFIDDRATRQQADALVGAFSGSLGGPLQELADLLGEMVAVERAPIVLRQEGRLTTLTVDRRIRVEGAAKEGPGGRRMTLKDGKLSNVLGTSAEVGESGRFRVGLAQHGMEMDVRGRSRMSGRFSYVHVPGLRVRSSGGHGS